MFVTDVSQNNNDELWTIDLTTWELERLTRFDESHGHVSSGDPVVLPDGRIIHSSDRAGPKYAGLDFLWIIDPATGKKTQITRCDLRFAPPGVNQWHDHACAALPDGRVVFTRYSHMPTRPKLLIELWMVDPRFARFVAP